MLQCRALQKHDSSQIFSDVFFVFLPIIVSDLLWQAEIDGSDVGMLRNLGCSDWESLQ